MISKPFLDQVSVALFYPHTLAQKHLHSDLIIWLAAINILTIGVTFLLAPAF